MAAASAPTGSSLVLPIDAMAVESRRLEEDCLFSAKGHFEAASSWSRAHYALGIPAAVFAAISGGSAFTNHPILAGSLAILVAALASIITFLNPRERANAHHLAGVKYNGLRQQARVFRTVDLQTEPVTPEARQRLSELTDAHGALGLSSPQIPRRAFERARKGIEHGEAEYAVDVSHERAEGP